MADVTYLAEYVAQQKAADYIYTCDNCGNDSCLLIGDGSIECSDCENVIENLTHNGGE